MALIHANSTCAICRERLDRPFTGTSGCAFREDHPLWSFCDAPIHLDCLASWPHREEFSRGYFSLSLDYHRTHGTLLAEADSWMLGCGPGTVPYYAEIRLRDWPFRLYSRWDEWQDYITIKFRARLSGPALEAATAVISEVHAIAPTLGALRELRAAKQKALAR